MTDFNYFAASGFYFPSISLSSFFQAGHLTMLIAALSIWGFVRYHRKYRNLLVEHHDQQQKLKHLKLATNNVFYEWHIETGKIEGCEDFAKLFGFSEHENAINHDLFLTKLHPDDQIRIKRVFEDALIHLDTFTAHYRLQTPEHEVVPIRQHGKVIRDPSGKPLKIHNVIQKDDKFADKASSENKQLQHIVTTSGLIGVITINPESRILSANEYIYRLSGHDQATLKNAPLRTLLGFPDLNERFLLAPNIDHNGIINGQFIHKNGTVSSVKLSVNSVNNDSGAIDYFVILISGICEHIEEDRKLLEREQRHKNTLIREVHHRIKNNLQGIFGLLQNNALEHPEAKAILEQSMLQINSLAITYGLQSKTENGEIYLCDIVHSSTEFCQRLFFSTNEAVDLQIPVDHPIRVDRDNAVSLSLIVNELLLNAIKHTPGVNKKLSVSLDFDKHHATFTVKNEPASLPQGFDFEQSIKIGTGLSLVKTLMPEQSRLCIYQTNNSVSAQLTMMPPLIFHKSQTNPFYSSSIK
ncbi:PAS domain-containing protein [Methylotuvimicrobium sp. KM2]|uniref:PAS domain-containing protein n=1 Tax=Methylotuvimicrobium sp. KM2 TaxID=3133976 RepID=UPI003101B049